MEGNMEESTEESTGENMGENMENTQYKLHLLFQGKPYQLQGFRI